MEVGLTAGCSVRETKLAELVGLTGPDVRKYLGMLHVHRLVKR
jgi:hypothetical protein